MKTALLRLFNAVQVDDKQRNDVPQSVLERTVKNGYVLHPAIRPNDKLLNAVESVVGISGEKANAAFHKSWQIIQDTPQESLWLQAVIHYFTTYGFEQLGIYRENTVYIPCEALELPDIQEDIPLVVIKAMNAKEILEAIINLGSGIALAQETLNDIMTIVKANQFDGGFVEDVQNRELKALLYDYYGLVPSEPAEFLRHLVSKLTNESLLIKNDYLIDKIKQSNGKFLDELIKDAPSDLASIFFRFKPLFLAMRSISRNKRFFNRLRKQADKLHKPMPEDYLNSVTAQIKHNRLELDALKKRIEKANVFRKIRLAYALNFRLINSPDAIVYRVRNGRGWVNEFEWANKYEGITKQALDIVLTSLADNIRKNIEGKTIYIPSNVNYALPATEKQFTGHLPTGSYVSVLQDLIVGIHWTNTDKRVDLDLSAIGETGKIGWDSVYRSGNNGILFSGDMTSAPEPNGATELFYIRQGEPETRILMANYYNLSSGDEVQCKILAAQEKPKNFGKNYMVDVSNIVLSANIIISKKQNVLGLITNVEGENRVYFANVSIGNSITSYGNEQSMQTRKYLIARLVNSIDFREVLGMAGAIIVDCRPDSGEYINLSAEALDKTTIVDLIKPAT
jgi:hypothetical protein